MFGTRAPVFGSVPLFLACLFAEISVAAESPTVGEEAVEFELKSLDDDSVKLSKLTKEGPVIVLVLRGYPGYQCPLCNRQVGEFLSKAKSFAERNAQIVMVYPGPADNLSSHAEEFVRGKTLPDNCHFVIDPDYVFVNAYSLRWDAPGETAYPATLVIDKAMRVRFAKISTTHAGRSTADETLKVVQGLN